MDIAPELQNRLESLAVMEALFDDVEDIVFFVKDRQGRYVLINRTVAARCGFSAKSDVLGKTAADVYPPPYGTEYLAQDRQVLESGKPIKDKLELQLYAHSVPGWCLTHKIPIFGITGAVVGMTGVSRDLHIPKERGENFLEMSAIIEHIRNHYDTPLRVEDLADMASISTYKLEQRMKRIFHLTAGQFIMHTRIDAARDMLPEEGTSIADIAVRCGFCDQSAFTRQFKAITGLTPSVFRRMRQLRTRTSQSRHLA
jgi:PAS domain S-box-containing protein